ncbi:transposase [Hymenobacter sp. ASUV-10]|uniref:Transposase n=1 Tax=Hymenobacter aranciens TaxID=3063996 RepID=A0ABT9BDZ8_9BACT|nr:transposase [Hymenobacter sp. ASUV-10]MDO7874738.1 transposase [Hymenobacter sp. ASUV-10]
MDGHKRHVAVDTLGLPLAVLVQAASVQDPVGAAPMLAEAKARAPDLQLLWADARY